MRPRRRLSEAQARNLMTTQSALTALGQHPSWPDLQQVVADKEQTIRKVIVAQALGPNPVDQRQADYLRGFVHGMRWFLAVPDQAEATLERFLKQQGISTEGSGS